MVSNRNFGIGETNPTILWICWKKCDLFLPVLPNTEMPFLLKGTTHLFLNCHCWVHIHNFSVTTFFLTFSYLMAIWNEGSYLWLAKHSRGNHDKRFPENPDVKPLRVLLLILGGFSIWRHDEAEPRGSYRAKREPFLIIVLLLFLLTFYPLMRRDGACC